VCFSFLIQFIFSFIYIREYEAMPKIKRPFSLYFLNLSMYILQCCGYVVLLLMYEHKGGTSFFLSPIALILIYFRSFGSNSIENFQFSILNFLSWSSFSCSVLILFQIRWDLWLILIPFIFKILSEKIVQLIRLNTENFFIHSCSGKMFATWKIFLYSQCACMTTSRICEVMKEFCGFFLWMILVGINKYFFRKVCRDS